MGHRSNRRVPAVLDVLVGVRARSLAAAVLLVFAAVVPALAAQSATAVLNLSNPVVTPTSGTTTTDITFTVTYHDQGHPTPAQVSVVVADSSHPMTAVADSKQGKQGVAFTATFRLPGGTWTTEFRAVESDGTVGTLDGPTVTIQAPSPTPKPTPTPTPDPTPTPRPTATPTPTPRPTATPTPTSTPTPRPTTPAITPAPTATPIATPVPTPPGTPRPTMAPTPSPTAGATSQPTPAPTGNATLPPAATPGPTATGQTTPTNQPTPTGLPMPSSPGDQASSSAAPAASGWPTPSAGSSDALGYGGSYGQGSSSSPYGDQSSSPAPSSSDGSIAIAIPPVNGGPNAGDGASSGDGTGGGPGGMADAPVGGASSSGIHAALLGAPSNVATMLLHLMPSMVVTTGGVAMTMAFFAFGRRRRDESPTAPDAVLANAAATGMPRAAGANLVPAAVLVADAQAIADAVRAATAAPATAGPVDGDIPRWRRQSLMEARKADPTRSVRTSVNLAFTGQAGEAVSGLERRQIRYRLVSLLDQPDDVRGVEIGSLDQGDEVVLLERLGTYLRVLCPDGREGWVHKMVLGSAIAESPAPAPAPTAAPMPTAMPSAPLAAARKNAGTTWTSADEGPAPGSFEDVLRLYSEQRQQFGEA